MRDQLDVPVLGKVRCRIQFDEAARREGVEVVAQKGEVLSGSKVHGFVAVGLTAKETPFEHEAHEENEGFALAESRELTADRFLPLCPPCHSCSKGVAVSSG